MRQYLIHTCHDMPMPGPCHALTMPFFSRPRRSTAVERWPVSYLPAFGFFRLPRGVLRRLLSETYQSSQRSVPTTVKNGSSTQQKRLSVKLLGLVVRVFPVTTQAFTKDTALSEHGRGAAWHVCINGTAWQGKGMGTAWAPHALCESAFRVNQMGKTHSKPLAAWHGRGTAWVRYGHGLLCVNLP
jgi:hypothetical protein